MIGPMSTPTFTGYSSDFKRGMHLRRNTKLNVYNSVIAGWPVGLYIDGSTTWVNAQASELQIKNCALVGMATNFAVPSGSSYTATDVQNWYNDASRGNSIIVDPATAKISGTFVTPVESVSPVVLPLAGSPLLTGADYGDARLSDTFFVKTGTFIGAFGAEDWTAGWVNWNPQQTVY